MELTPHLEAIRGDLESLIASDEGLATAFERMARPIEATLQLRLLDVLVQLPFRKLYVFPWKRRVARAGPQNTLNLTAPTFRIPGVQAARCVAPPSEPASSRPATPTKRIPTSDSRRSKTPSLSAPRARKRRSGDVLECVRTDICIRTCFRAPEASPFAPT